MGYRVLCFLVGQQPNEQFMANRITRDIGFGQQPSIVREVFAANELFHISIQATSHWLGNDTASMGPGGLEAMSCIALVARNRCPNRLGTFCDLPNASERGNATGLNYLLCLIVVSYSRKRSSVCCKLGQWLHAGSTVVHWL